MRARKRVTRRKTSAKPAGKKIARIEAVATRRARYLPAEMEVFYKPLKKLVTLRLDSDILAWFRRGGHGYQTRINKALRKLMQEERRPG